MNIFLVYRITKEGTMYEVSKDGEYTKLQSNEVLFFISDIVTKVRQSTFIYVRDLNGLKCDIIRALDLCGVRFVVGNPRIKDMADMDCKSLIGGDIPKIYHLTVVNHSKKVQFIDLDNLLPDIDSVLKSWGKHESFSYVKAYERGLEDLFKICKVQRKRPLTVAGATRGLLKKVMPDFQPIDITKLMIKEEGDLDKFIRNAYRGGLCTYKPRTYIQHEGKGICVDIHSMYPYVMITRPMPISNPGYFKGEPTKKDFALAEKGEKAIFIHITACFTLKENGVPCVRSDDITTEPGWLENSYLHNIATGKTIKSDREIDLFLTYMDYMDFLDNYDVKSIHYIDYVTMDCIKNGLFMPIVRPLYKKKRHSTGGERAMVKIVLNSISGTVAMRNTYENYAIQIKDGMINFKKIPTSVGKSYIYLGAYITSWARHILIDIIKNNYDRWIYSDTDCLFLKGTEIPDGLKVGEGIGAFAIEKEFDDIVIYKQKMYGYMDSKTKEYKFTLAGVKKSDIAKIPDIMKDEELVYGELYTKGNYGYKLREERERLRHKVEEYELDIIKGDFFEFAQRPSIEDMSDWQKRDLSKIIKLESQFSDVSCKVELYKAQFLKKPSLLDLVPRAKLPMTGQEFEDFELYLYDYYMQFDDMTTYA